MEGRRRNEDFSEDYPTHSRLFIVCERTAKEEDFRDAFSKFGTIEDIRIPRDHKTGEPKGVVFIKFSKTSEAARALEEMSFKPLPNGSRPLRVMVATNRSDIHTEEPEEGRYRRLFLHVPKQVDEQNLQEEFSQFGHIDSIQVQRDRDTGESKGFAYIKFRKFSEAAHAYEECDRKYRAIFAKPKGGGRRPETSFESNIHNLAMSSSNRASLISMMNPQADGYTKVNFMCCPGLTRMHVQRLFDIVPGMVNCQYFVDLIRNHGKGTISYSNPISAAHAVEKLNLFEYPPGMRIFVKPDNSNFGPHEQNFTNLPNVMNNLKNAMTSATNSSAPDLAQLAAAIAEASKLIKVATAGVTDDDIPDSNKDLSYCSVTLPAPKPLADIDSPVAKRCFLVCKPHPPPLSVLRDVFCRFGDLINVYTLPNKTVGYARYASETAANEAIKTLHGAEICSVRIKVLEAEEEAPNKRMRYD